MPTAERPAPTITNAATVPPAPHKLFVNIPVADLQASIRFFESLGFAFNRHFTDATGTCMLVGADAYFMLLDKARFAGFSRSPLADPRAATAALFAIGVESRAEVDDMVQRAIAAGGSHAVEPMDHGFMYGWSFRDLDGYHWEVFWMDPSATPG